MKPGFIGIGAISEHVITGLIQQSGFDEILVISERSSHRSVRLANRFPNVRVEPDNQGIVDQVDVVFVATLPQQTLDLLDTLSFRQNQIIVSMAAMISVEQIAEKVKPASRIHRIIPMPPNELGVGPIPIYPPSPDLTELLSRIGTVIPVEDQQQFSTFSASSAIMATLFELVATNARWIQSRGVAPEVASKYSTALFHSLATQAKELGADELQSLSTECLTAGGLNEQVLNAARSEGWFDELTVELDKVLRRISD
jgi:pyrroline-5-carboxylate reductase